METKDKKSNGLLAMAAQTPPAPQTAQAAPAAPAAPAATPAGLFGTGLRQSGFCNVFENGKATGFQVAVVNSYYRGTYASLTEYFDVTVDGEKFPRESITCTFEGTTITQDKLDGSKLRWPYTEPCILTVSKPGGLKPGLHEVTVEYPQRISYMPNPRSVRKLTAKLAIGV
jgi:hypothetical protein